MLVKIGKTDSKPHGRQGCFFFFHFKVRLYRCLWREECPLHPKTQITGKSFCSLMTGFFLVKQKKKCFSLSQRTEFHSAVKTADLPWGRMCEETDVQKRRSTRE